MLILCKKFFFFIKEAWKISQHNVNKYLKNTLTHMNYIKLAKIFVLMFSSSRLRKVKETFSFYRLYFFFSFVKFISIFIVI